MSTESPTPFLERDPDSQPDYGRDEANASYQKNLKEQRADPKAPKEPKYLVKDDARWKALKKKLNVKDSE